MLRPAAQTWLVLALALAACEGSSPAGHVCPAPGPAFRLQLTAADGELPADTRLEVRYGGQQVETYALGDAAGANVDVCCRRGSATSGELPPVSCVQHADAGADDGQAILCDLWTDGLAEVKVRGEGYPLMDRTLVARVTDEKCGVDTLDVRLELTHGDGGT